MKKTTYREPRNAPSITLFGNKFGSSVTDYRKKEFGMIKKQTPIKKKDVKIKYGK